MKLRCSGYGPLGIAPHMASIELFPRATATKKIAYPNARDHGRRNICRNCDTLGAAHRARQKKLIPVQPFTLIDALLSRAPKRGVTWDPDRKRIERTAVNFPGDRTATRESRGRALAREIWKNITRTGVGSDYVIVESGDEFDIKGRDGKFTKAQRDRALKLHAAGKRYWLLCPDGEGWLMELTPERIAAADAVAWVPHA